MEATTRTSVRDEVPSTDPADCNEDLRLAQLAIRVHCSIDWPEGLRCMNCTKPYPCEVYAWGEAALLTAGWMPEQVAALDARTGAWS